VSPYVRTVKTTSGATAVQIVHSSRRGSRDIEHLGSAHDDVELELLKAAARQRLAAGQGELDLGLEATGPARRGAQGGPLPITATRMECLLDALEHAYRVLGLEDATGGDEVFAQLVLARIIEPVSKLDSLRVLEEAGVAAASYRTVTRRLRAFAADSWRQQISAACAAHAGLGPASLLLYDVSTLYFETGTGDGFREGGFSKERRLEPQITNGQERSAGEAGLPPQARVHRSAPDHRVRRPGGQPLDRAPHRLVHPQIRQDRPPLPHHPDPSRAAHNHRRRPAPRRPPPRPRRDQQPDEYALTWPNSGDPAWLAVSSPAASWSSWRGSVPPPNHSGMTRTRGRSIRLAM
jgi:hypothetical protein